MSRPASTTTILECKLARNCRLKIKSQMLFFIQNESSIVLKTLHILRGLKSLIRLIVCAIMFRN